MTSVLLTVEQLRRPVPGGIGTYAESLSRALAGLAPRERPEVVLYAARPPAPTEPDPLAELGLPLRSSRLAVRGLTLAWDAGLSGVAKDYGLVHATSLSAPPPLGRPLVVTVHDLAWRASPEAFPPRGRRWHEAALRRVRSRARAFVVPSQATAAALVAAGVPEARVAVVPHGADHLPPPDPEATAERLRALGVEGPYLLAVGTLEPRKNLPRLFAAYRLVRPKLPDPWPLVVVGAAGWGSEVRPVDGVVLAGPTGPPLLAGLYAGARCTAYVPLVEGFGLPVVESMAAGTPVVASAVPSAGSAVRVVDPLDVESIAAGLLDAALEGPRREELVAAGRARAAALTWHSTALGHVGVWQRVLAGEPLPPWSACEAPAGGGGADPTGAGGAGTGEAGHAGVPASGAARERRVGRRPAPDGALGTSVGIDVSAVPLRPAGAGRYVVELARRVAARDDVAVTLVTRRDDGQRWTAVAPHARVLPLAPSARPARLAWEQLALWRALSRTGAGVEVLHAPHYSMPRRSSVPVVVTVHDLTFIDHPEWHERSKALVFGHAIRTAARRAAAVVCVSEATGERFVELLRPDCPVHVVPHGVDTEMFSSVEPADGADAAALGSLGVREPYVLHVGTIEPRKDVPSLLRAFERVAARSGDLTLVLAGAAGWGARAVAATLAGMRHAGRVQQLGFVGGEVLPSLLRRATVVAYPSLAEGFGLPALEALACGAPLVTTAGTAMGDLAGDAALLVPAGDAAAIAGALEEVLDDGPALAERRERGLALAASHSWEHSAEQHARIYAAVAGEGLRRRR